MAPSAEMPVRGAGSTFHAAMRVGVESGEARSTGGSMARLVQLIECGTSDIGIDCVMGQSDGPDPTPRTGRLGELLSGLTLRTLEADAATTAS